VVTNSGRTNLLSSPLLSSFVRLHPDLTGPPTGVDPDLTTTVCEDPAPHVGHAPLQCTREVHAVLNGKTCPTHSFNLCNLKNAATPTDEFGHGLPPDTSPNPRNAREKNDWYPFTSRIEFETAEFLFTCNQMPQAQVDMLMQLWAASMLPHNGRAPFTDHRDLHRVIDAIPLGDVPWQSIQVQYSGEIPETGAPSWMQKSYDVWFRDPNAVVENLLSNPDFNNHFDYAPYREFEPSGQRRWENMMSGNWAWNHAVCQQVALIA